MIGIIYTGESEKEFMSEYEWCNNVYSFSPKIFVEPHMEKIFMKNMDMNIFDKRIFPLHKDAMATYCGMEITNSKRESDKREKRNQTTFTMKQIADKLGVPVEKLRIKE